MSNASHLHLPGPSPVSEHVYFDGNALTRLWDRHTKRTGEGKTGDPIEDSPFHRALLSIYTVDEFLTIKPGNALKKHLVFASIYPEIPIMKSLDDVEFEGPPMQLPLDGLLLDDGVLPGLAANRALAMASHPENVRSLQRDLAHKEERIAQNIAREKAEPIQYVQESHRASLKEAVKAFLEGYSLDPGSSFPDYRKLIRLLYQAEVMRLVDASSKTRKGPDRRLNQQIDFYHLMYLPLVGVFVTDDQHLADIARQLVSQFGFPVEVRTSLEHEQQWIRSRLSG